MSQTWQIFKREFAAYFATPLAYVFIVIFLFAMGAFTFYIGRFYDGGVADLGVFFSYHPWLYLFLVPAISMRLWAGRGLHSQETCATMLLHTAIRILQSGQKSVLAVLVLIPHACAVK